MERWGFLFSAVSSSIVYFLTTTRAVCPNINPIMLCTHVCDVNYAACYKTLTNYFFLLGLINIISIILILLLLYYYIILIIFTITITITTIFLVFLLLSLVPVIVML